MENMGGAYGSQTTRQEAEEKTKKNTLDEEHPIATDETR